MKRPFPFPASGMYIAAYVKDHNPTWCTFYLDLPFTNSAANEYTIMRICLSSTVPTVEKLHSDS